MKRMKLETYGSKFKTIRLKQHLRSGSLIEKLNRYIFVQLKHNLNQKSKGNQNKTASIDFILPRVLNFVLISIFSGH